ncbi:hypothetical protein H6G27_19930 [Nostoc linckia FACHB-104]|nr:hypothetical protein [Nostoc linckia FACHB-104]
MPFNQNDELGLRAILVNTTRFQEEKLGTSALGSCTVIGTGDGLASLVLGAKIIDSSLGKDKQITVFTRVNSIPSIKLIDYPPINKQFLILFLNLAVKYVFANTSIV